ncbi:uncharacterized protein LOC126373923 [Pectinophora gossypiella]|uniref:uncharacterized protein LOC126373923 n=1 Tax=Pectinophora gossypiella TaxID=13191 RepID=UPI00214E6918|nr:uncharacterized protein LOC126373923 [Pectinophora gossypiella]
MACGRTVFVWITILASLTFILAEEGSGAGRNDNANERMSFSLPTFGMSGSFGGLSGGGLPNFGQFLGGGGSNDSSNLFNQFVSAFSQFIPRNGSRTPSMGSMGSMHMDGSRHARDVNGENREERAQGEQSAQVEQNEQGANGDHQDRLFFGSFFGVPVSCNYTTQPGTTCAGCATRLVCLPGNRGYLRRCGFLHPYCNNGRCSKIAGSACFTSSTAAATTNTAATTGTT